MAASIHHIPGRLRLRSALTRGYPGRAEGLAQLFQAVDGVLSTQISERTGSLTILYNPRQLDADTLYRVVDRVRPVVRDTRVVSPKRAARVTQAGQVFGKAAFDVFVAKALERSVVSLLTALR